MIIKYLSKYKGKITLYLLLNILSIAILLKIYNIYGDMFASNIKIQNYIQILAIFVVELFLLLMTVNIISYLQFNISYSTAKDVRMDLFKVALDKTENLPYISYIINDLEIIEDDFYYNLLDLFSTFLQAFIFLYAIFNLDFRYGLVAITLTIPILYFQYKTIKKVPETNKIVLENTEIELSLLRKAFSKIIDIKTNNISDAIISKIDKVFDSTVKSKIRHNQEMVIGSSLLMFSIYLLKGLSTIIFINDGFRTILEISTVALLIGYTNNVANPMRSFLQSIIQLFSTKEIKNRVEKALVINLHENSEVKSFKIEELTLDKISVLSKGKKILNNIKFNFTENKHYAIVGKNGSGKSTIIKVIMGLIPFEGDLWVNNEKVSIESIRKNIGYMPQNCTLINSTIRDNITMFDKNISDEKIVRVLKQLNLERLITNQGLDRNISNESNNISSGEKKRICLARLLCRDYSVLLLDEVTSALDKENTEMIEKVIRGLKDKIVISIIHKPEYLKYYDHVLELGNETLMEKNNEENK